jgi:hypothetical protein
MKPVIAISCYQRPEFLFITLNSYLRCKEINDYDIFFFPDCGHDPEIHTVIDWFKQNVNTSVKTFVKNHRKNKQLASYNIMDSYRISIEESNAPYLIIGEEDTPVSNDFLKFNKYCHDNYLTNYDRIFCVAHKRRHVVHLSGGPTLLIGDPQCTSPTCITRKSIQKYMLPIMQLPGYFEDPSSFFAKYYPNSRIKPEHGHIDHDGAIERIIEENNLFAIKPDQARTNHIGFVGGHLKEGRYLGHRLTGTLQEKITYLNTVLCSGLDMMKKHATHIPEHEKNNWVGITYTNIDIPEWNKLELDLDRNKSISSPSFYDDSNTFKQYIDNYVKS